MEGWCTANWRPQPSFCCILRNVWGFPCKFCITICNLSLWRYFIFVNEATHISLWHVLITTSFYSNLEFLITDYALKDLSFFSKAILTAKTFAYNKVPQCLWSCKCPEIECEFEKKIWFPYQGLWAQISLKFSKAISAAKTIEL